MTEDQLRTILNEELAKFAGQINRHVDGRLDGLRNEVKDETSRIFNSVDGIAGSLDTERVERAAITRQLDRQADWIGQLARATSTKLVPEQ